MSSDGNKDRSAWTWTSLGEVEGIALQNGLYKPASAYGRGTPIVRINDFNNEGRLVSSDLQRVEVSAREISTFGLREGDILVNRVNSLSHIGKSVKVSGLASPTIYESNMMRVRLNGGPLRPRFLAYYLQLDRTREYFRTVAKQAVAQASINQDDLMALSVPVPSLSEQDEVVEILWAWERIIETIERLILAKRERKRGLMQVLLTGKKRFMEFHDLPRPKVSLGSQIDRIVGGGTPTRSEASYWDSTGIPWITVKDLKREVIWDTEEHISERGLRESSATLVPAGTVIVATRMAVGKSVRCQVPAAINQDLKALFPKTTLRSDYLHLVLQASQPSLEAIASGSTVKGIRLADLRGLTFELPSVEEQARISAVLSVAEKEVETLERQLEAYSLQKRGLMQQLLTGKKRVKVDNPEAVPA